MAHLVACMPGATDNKLEKVISFCEETPLCPNYLMVSAEGINFVGSADGGTGGLAQCASILQVPIRIKIAGVCKPLGSGTKPPTKQSEQTAVRAAYQQMENLAVCVSTLPFDPCSYRTRPTVTCDVEGSTYAAVAEFSLVIDCVTAAPTGGHCC